MIINHNIAAMNTYRQLTGNNSATSKSLEKLSSGLKINRAGDNAAGLAISEKMRGQIRGLDQASTNANDGISLIQTAEGALNETHSILQRMRELAVQSSNDTNTDDDRQEIQKEINQLTQEIDRISSDTEFNTQKLLNGDKAIDYTKATTLSGVVEDVSFDAGVAGGTYTVAATITAAAATASNATGGISGNVPTVTTTNLAAGSYNLNIDAAKKIATITDVEGRTIETADLSDPKNLVIADINLSGAVASNGSMSLKVTTAKKEEITVKNLAGDTVKGINVDLEHDANTASGTITVDASKSVRFQIGSNTGQGTSLNIGDMGAEELGVDNLDLTTQAGADFAITTIDKALSQVSSERAKLGAVQNRLEHTINNLGTSSENLTAAESRIRDVDMAKEMMEFTKNNILSQASQAMLAQANQQPQGVLQLLQ